MADAVYGEAELWLADCRDVLPSLSPNHVIGDPPYEEVLHAAAKDERITRTDGYGMVGDLGFVGIDADRAEIAKLCVERSSGWLILFSIAEGVRAWRDDIQTAGGKWDTTLAWVKPDASPRFNGQGAARGFECAITAWCGRGYRSWNGGGKRGVYTHGVNNGRHGAHPTEKPLALMKELIADFTQPGELICDPFMGSGTTGVAALQLGRRFVGMERDPKWFMVACERISGAAAQPLLFQPEPQAKAQKLFG